MKKLFTLLTFAFCIINVVIAQVPPNAFNYSAVARNTAGLPIANTTIGIQIGILKTSALGALQYQENHFVNTDAYGLFNLTVGAGAVQIGSMAAINWSNDNYYLKVGMDANGSTNFLTMGTTQLLSVPYALHAATADSIIGGVAGFSGNYNDLTNAPTNVSAFTNDAGYISAELDSSLTNELQTLSITNDTLFLSNGGFAKLPAGFSGNYNDLTNKPITVTYISTNGDTLFLSNDEFFISGSSSNMQPGNSPGQMNYWDGNTWVNINPGQDGQKLTFCNGIPSWDPCANGPHVVGEFFQGGIIAYLLQPSDEGYDPNIQHGIVATQFDQGSIEWGCAGTDISGADSLSVGFGNQNSMAIVNSCPSSNAANICLNFNYNGYNDWYLPSKEELHKLYLFKDQIGGFETFAADYWSSSEDGLNNAWMFDFSAGYPISANKSNYMYIRPIRSF